MVSHLVVRRNKAVYKSPAVRPLLQKLTPESQKHLFFQLVLLLQVEISQKTQRAEVEVKLPGKSSYPSLEQLNNKFSLKAAVKSCKSLNTKLGAKQERVQ